MAPTPLKATLLAAASVLLAPSPAAAENWPQWRGPSGDGTSPEKDLPLEWSREKNVLWRRPLPGAAGSTPAVWGETIFLTSADGADIVLIAISTAGKELWRRKLGTGNRAVRGDEGNSAAPSPSTDGEHVWAMAGTGELACHDLAGKEVWKFDLEERHGRYRIQFGMTSTPVLHGDSLYIHCIHSGTPYVLALDKKTGKDRWKVERKTDARAECEHAYTSPILYRDADRSLLLVHGADWITAHGLEDGSEVWRSGELNRPGDRYNPTLRFVASPVCRPGRIIVPSAKNGPVHCLRPGGASKAGPERVWALDRNTPDVPTPALDEKHVYLLRETGVLIVLDGETGKALYEERVLSERVRASPVVADGKVYCTAADGETAVVKAGGAFELLARNSIDERVAATIVVSGGRLYLRSYDALYAIGRADPPAGGDAAGGGR